MKRIEELHLEHNIYTEYKNFYVAYKLNKTTRRFDFQGYHCTKCGRVLLNKDRVPTHNNSCQYINSDQSYNRQEISPEALVLNKSRGVWLGPFEINQNNPVATKNSVTNSHK